MMNFTRRMAFGFLRRGNRSMGTLSDFAVRYIEENLAETIIEQGGWVSDGSPQGWGGRGPWVGLAYSMQVAPKMCHLLNCHRWGKFSNIIVALWNKLQATERYINHSSWYLLCIVCIVKRGEQL